MDAIKTKHKPDDEKRESNNRIHEQKEEAREAR
jgi:hypothetical protein